MKSKALVPWLLLTALMPAVLCGIESVELQLGARVTWSEQPTQLGPRCFGVWVPGPGLLAIELATSAPSSAPGILVLADTGGGAVPKTAQRIEAVMLRVSEPGKHLIYLGSQASLGNVELTVSFFSEELATKERDEDETELEPDP